MDATGFRQASHAVWEAMAPGWDRRHAYFEETARPITELMLERLAPAPGQELLELAAGTGIVGLSAASLVGADGRVIVSDFSESMVEITRRRAAELGLANVECRVLDAERLDLPDDRVDGALCRWGYMLLADPAAALRETRRVLRPGGRLSSAVFDGAEQNPWVGLPMAVLLEAGHVLPPAAGAPGILALADRVRLRELFTGAGFGDPAIEEVPFEFSFDDLDDYLAFLTHVAGAIAMVLRRLSDGERRHFDEQLALRAQPFERGGRLEFPGVSLVVSAS